MNNINIFSTIPSTAKSVLFFGNFKQCFGNIGVNLMNIYNEIASIKKHCIDNNGILHVVVLSDEDCKHMMDLINVVGERFCKDANGYKKVNSTRLHKNVCVWNYKQDYDVDNIFKYIKRNCSKNMQYDYIIQNPPYSGSLHLEYVKKGLELLKKDSGKMTIIEPAKFYIDLRKYGKRNEKARTNSTDILMYDEIKKLLKGHVSKVVIENMNKEFRTGLYVPFAITYVDYSKEYNSIEFELFGEKKVVSDLYQCNMIGDYETIWNIFNKVQKYGDMMKDHIYDPKRKNEFVTNEKNWYSAYPEIIGGAGSSLCGIYDCGRNPRNFYDDTKLFNNDVIFINTFNGCYIKPYIHVLYHLNQNEISNNIVYRHDKGNNLTDQPADCVYDTKEHLENWKHFVFNNKLPLFINMCLTIDQHNHSKEFIPWIVDKQYTDEEINKLFDFSPEEIALIDKTIKKFERNSPWFKRYICGKDSVSDEEVQKFIDSL